jgi:hypothetical protein
LAHFALDLNCGLSVIGTKLMMSIPMGLKIESYAQNIDTAGGKPRTAVKTPDFAEVVGAGQCV